MSLLGLIIFQASWLKNLLAVRQEQLYTKVTDAANDVASELSMHAYSGPTIKIPIKPGLSLGAELASKILTPPTIREKFTPQEIHEKIHIAFAKNGIKDVHFEFAITNQSEELEMRSAFFEREFFDTVHNKTIAQPLIPESGSVLEGLVAYETLILVVPDFKTQVWESLRLIIAAAILFTLIMIAAFYVTVKTLLHQKKVSEIKSDFINNMTHEFKTPLATISLAVDALKSDKVIENKEKLAYFRGIIKEENERMNKHVETILQAAVSERQDLQLDKKAHHIHEIINQVIYNQQLPLKEKNGVIHTHFNADNDVVQVDEIHFSNLISNLIDNAIKYSENNTVIHITTNREKKHFIIKVEDNGIGMSKETVKRIFEKFYRAHTGNLHNVKGFGLGMNYVKSVIDAHKGKIKVESILGKGSTFIIEVPLS